MATLFVNHTILGLMDAPWVVQKRNKEKRVLNSTEPNLNPQDLRRLFLIISPHASHHHKCGRHFPYYMSPQQRRQLPAAAEEAITKYGTNRYQGPRFWSLSSITFLPAAKPRRSISRLSPSPPANGKSRLEFFLLFFCEMVIKVSHICSNKTSSGGKRG